jgi:putative effector of murein hydrolase LrgA (UPF0299 family)
MRHTNRILIGIILMFISVGCLWWGSPVHTGSVRPIPGMMYAFVVLFALGFMFAAMGLLAMKDDYAALLSAFVLYFMIGGLIAVMMYVNGRGQWSLAEAESPTFWAYWIRMMAMWPLELVKMMGWLGYR